MEDKKYSNDPCSNCGELGGTYKIRLEPICNCCAEEEGTNIIVEITKKCFGCDALIPVNLANLELLEHINKHLEEVEVADE